MLNLRQIKNNLNLLYWLNSKELKGGLKLLSLFPLSSIGVEIGVHTRGFSSNILKLIKPAKLFLIDPWKYEPYPRYRNSVYGSQNQQQQDGMDTRYNRVCNRFSKEIEAGVVTILRQSSAEAANYFDSNSVDWVYIDGNHTYEFVKQDLQLYFPKVKAGGFICGDDYGIKGWWEGGIMKAVNEFKAEHPNLHFQQFGTQFLFSK
jgi:hypothetical protein